MTPKTQPTTLQLARELIRCEKELHYINHGYATILQHQPVITTEQDDMMRQMVRDALDNVSTQYNVTLRQYLRRFGRRAGFSPLMNHVYKLGDLALEYAWK